MTTRYDAQLNGVSLAGIDPAIIVLDINYQPPQIRTDTVTSAMRQGARVYRRYVGRTSVSIRFEIHAYDTEERMEICNKVQKWAKKGGVLTTSDRDGQRLRCICETLPVINSAMRWTEALSVVFSAYEIPFWEDTEATEVTMTGTDGTSTISVPGSVDDAVVEVDITAGGALTDISLTVGGRTLSLSGLTVASGEHVTITYDDHMIQHIMSGSTSLLDKRTGADDLLAACGENNTFQFEANVSCTVVFAVRGLWM